MVALLDTLAVIAGLHALQRVRYGRLGTAGSLLAFAGHALMLVAATATALARREALDAVFPRGALAALVGSVLLGTATLRPEYCRASTAYSLSPTFPSAWSWLRS